MANVADPSRMMKCGCDMMGNCSSISEGLWLIESVNNDNSHECSSWWCRDCHRSEWRCEATGKGRMCK